MIIISDFDKRYGDKIIFHNFSLQIREGEIVGISGASGCGKTTLLNCLCGFDHDYNGTIQIDNRIMQKKVKPNERNIALVMQEPVLWPHMTVKENILFPLSNTKKKEKYHLFEETCQRMMIQELINRYPSEISGGQAKRVSFARAIMSDKDILLLDEPLSNVDTETKQEIVHFLQEKYLKNKTIIYVSHDINELEMICNRTICL